MGLLCLPRKFSPGPLWTRLKRWRRRETSCHCMGKVEMPKLAYRYGTLTPSPARTRVLLIASATARFIGVAILWVPIANAPAGFVQRSGGGKNLFSFNRTSGSCWRCKPVCRVKASIPAAIWATPPAPLPHRVRGHPRLQHRQPKFASSVTRLGESAAIGHSPRGVFFDGTVLFPAELPAIDCRPTADMASRPRSSARLPCQALAQRIRRDAAV